MKNRRVVIVVVIALLSAACTAVSAPSGSPGGSASPPTSTALATDGPSVPVATSTPTLTPTPEAVFRTLDLPDKYTGGSAEAVDGTTAVGFVKVGKLDDEQPAVWDTTTGALHVLTLPPEFVYANGDTFVRLRGVSGTTAVGTGALGTKDQRGLDRAMAWNTQTGELRILDIPAGFQRTEAHAISGATAVGEAWTTGGEIGRPVAWDTRTGAVRTLKSPAKDDWVSPNAISGETVVGTRIFQDDPRPLVWNALTAEARDLDLLPTTMDGVPRAVDGTTAVGWCCFGEEGTSRPLVWDTGTGSVRQLALPAPHVYGKANGVSGPVAIGYTDFTPVVWDLGTGEARVLTAPAGYEAAFGINAVSGQTMVGSVCEPPASASENPRCVPAAWTLP